MAIFIGGEVKRSYSLKGRPDARKRFINNPWRSLRLRNKCLREVSFVIVLLISWLSESDIIQCRMTSKKQEGQNQLDPNYIVGFVDGEGCFSVTCSKRDDIKAGYEIKAAFEMEVVIDDYPIMRRIYETMNKPGQLYSFDFKRYPNWRPHCKMKVSNLKDITEKVIPFFQKYPLQSKKQKSFKVFCKIVRMIQNKKHLHLKHAIKIVALRNTMNPTGKGNRKSNMVSRSAVNTLATP